jgi:hypothetical protein
VRSALVARAEPGSNPSSAESAFWAS